TDRCGAQGIKVLARIKDPQLGASERGAGGRRLQPIGVCNQGDVSAPSGIIRATLARPRSLSRPMAISAPMVRSAKEAPSISAEMAFSSGVTRILSDPKM